MGDVKHDWEKMRGQRGRELSSRQQGELKNWGECRAGSGTRGEEQPGRISYSSEKARKQGRYMGVRAKTGISNRVRWLNYCCIILHL